MNLETLTVLDFQEAGPGREALAARVGGVAALLRAGALVDEPIDGARRDVSHVLGPEPSRRRQPFRIRAGDLLE